MDCWRWNKTETLINFSVKCYIIISIFTRISSIACKPKSAKWLQHYNRTFKQPRRRQQQRTLETIIVSRSKTTLSFSCGSNFLQTFRWSPLTCTTTTNNFPIRVLRSWTQRNSSPFFNCYVNYCPQAFYFLKLRGLPLTNWWRQINVIELKGTQNHFSVTFSLPLSSWLRIKVLRYKN